MNECNAAATHRSLPWTNRREARRSVGWAAGQVDLVMRINDMGPDACQSSPDLDM